MTTVNQVGVGLSGASGTGNFAGTTSATLTTPKIAQINDTNSNAILELSPVGSAVNYLTIYNNAASAPPTIVSTGSDTNIGITLTTKGTGPLQVTTAATTEPLILLSGTGSQHSTYFSFTDSNAARTVTFPDASGTVQLQGSAIISAPGNSATASLSVGSNFQNTTGNDIVLTVYLAVSAATSASILLGVGSASSPTQQTIVSGLTLAALGIIAVPIYIPNNYYALLSTSGTITQTISGQIAMPV